VRRATGRIQEPQQLLISQQQQAAAESADRVDRRPMTMQTTASQQADDRVLGPRPTADGLRGTRRAEPSR
jgi:hypothetical protein